MGYKESDYTEAQLEYFRQNLVSGAFDFRRAAAGLLFSHYLRRGDFSALEKLMEIRNPAICLGIIETVMRSMYNSDIIPIFPFLIRYLVGEDIAIKENAMLKENVPYVIHSVAFEQGCDRVKSYRSVRKLEAMQARVEEAAGLLVASRADPRVASVQQTLAHLLKRIAARKAHLTQRRDGELLAGETIPLPPQHRNRGVYAMVQRGRSHV